LCFISVYQIVAHFDPWLPKFTIVIGSFAMFCVKYSMSYCVKQLDCGPLWHLV